MTRMTAERLKEIEALRRDNREACHWGHVGDLLAELRAVQQERDEARAAQDENADACEAMSREVERLHNSANMWSKAAQDNKDNMDAWASECKTLRAELAKYKAVAAAAKSIDWMDNAHDASIYIVTRHLGREGGHMTCETCGSKVKVVGNTTKHYEPDTSEVEKLRARVAQLEEALRLIQEATEHMYSEGKERVVLLEAVETMQAALEQYQHMKLPTVTDGVVVYSDSYVAKEALARAALDGRDEKGKGV